MKTVVHDWPKYVEGDLFAEIQKAPPGHRILIPHVVNNIGKWGAGFSGPLGEAFPWARMRYEKLARRYGSEIPLGCAELAGLPDEHIVVSHMVAQDGVGTQERRVRYDALAKCMTVVAEMAKFGEYAIHAPKFGAGLAGGNWGFIEELIRDCWIRRGIEVTVYWLPEKGNARGRIQPRKCDIGP